MASENAPMAAKIQMFHSSAAWIQSELPVKSPRGEGWDTMIERLSELLAQGFIAECDPKRPGFFEVVVGETWLYFHIAERLGYVYLIAQRKLDKTPLEWILPSRMERLQTTL